MAEKFQQRYRIPSSRASWHNYGGGAYFVTVCTTGMHHYFGKIQNGEMILSELGEYLDECIKNITKHSRYAEIPLYVVMPNHIHLIVYINSTNAMLVETVHAPSDTLRFQKYSCKVTGVDTVHAPSDAIVLVCPFPRIFKNETMHTLSDTGTYHHRKRNEMADYIMKRYKMCKI